LKYLPVVALVHFGRTDPVAQHADRKREDARLNVLADAMFYWRSAHQPVVETGEFVRGARLTNAITQHL
jgi:hypothetical protein